MKSAQAESPTMPDIICCRVEALRPFSLRALLTLSHDLGLGLTSANGSFLQTLRCVRLNNQAGEGKAPSRLTSSGQSKFKKAVSNKKEIKVDKTVGQKIKDWFKSQKGTYDGGIDDYGDGLGN